MTRNTATSHSADAVFVYGNTAVRRDVVLEPAGVNRPARVSGNCDLNDLGLLLGLMQPSSALVTGGWEGHRPQDSRSRRNI